MNELSENTLREFVEKCKCYPNEPLLNFWLEIPPSERRALSVLGGAASTEKAASDTELVRVATELQSIVDKMKESFDLGLFKLNDYTSELYERVERAATK